MITLIRYMIMNYKRTKIKLAFYTVLDKLLRAIEKDPENVQNKLTEVLLNAQFKNGMFDNIGDDNIDEVQVKQDNE